MMIGGGASFKVTVDAPAKSQKGTLRSCYLLENGAPKA